MALIYDRKRGPTVRILLEDAAKKQFKPEWQAILQLAFQDGQSSADDVAVTKRLSGYSDAQTFIVQVTYRDRNSSFVIKFGRRSIIESEFENSQKVDGNALYGTPIIPNRIYPRKDEERDWEWAFNQSTLAVESQTLLSYLTSLKKNPINFSADSIDKILNSVFKRRSDTIQSTGIAYAYRDFYDRLLPVHFHFRGRDIGEVKNFREIDGATLDSSKLIEYEKTLPKTKDIVYLKNFRIEKEDREELTLCPDQPPTDESFKIRIKYKLDNRQGPFAEPVSLYATDPETRSEILHKPVRGFVRKDPETHKMPATFTYGKEDKITYPNPIYYKDQLLEANNQMKIALIHGDLNLFNILVSSDGDQTQKFLIDFADTKSGPVLLDFQWLEVNVILWLVAPEIKKPSLDNKAIVEILKALHRSDSEPPPRLQHLKMWYTVLHQIRLLAKPYMKDWSEYYRGLTLLLLGSLRLHGKPIPDLESSNLHVAFLFAATTLCWTKLASVDLTKISKEIRTPDSEFDTPVRKEAEPNVQPPAIAHDSIPQWLFPDQKFTLRGTAQVGAELYLLIDQSIRPDHPIVNREGNWEAKVYFDTAGTYGIRVQYAETTIVSIEEPVVVQKLPSIHPSNPSKRIYVDRPFTVSGMTYPHAQLQVLAGPTILGEPTADEHGTWEIKTAQIANAGTHELVARYVVDKSVTSNIVSVAVYQFPVIDKDSLSQSFRAGKPHSLSGYAPPNTQVHVKTDRKQGALATPTTDGSGKWDDKIILHETGQHNLSVWDDDSAVASLAMPVEVTHPLPVIRFLSVVATILTVIGVAWFLIKSGGGIGSLFPRPTFTPPLPTASPLAPTATTLPLDVRTAKTAEKACEAIKQANHLTIAASDDSGPYSYIDHVVWKGFEIELLKKVVSRCTKRSDVDKILEWLQVKIYQRDDFLQKHPEAAALVGSVTQTTDRCIGDKENSNLPSLRNEDSNKVQLCTESYAVDHQALAVNKDDHIQGECDPAIQIVVVITGTIAANTFDDYVNQCRQNLIKSDQTLRAEFNPTLQKVFSREEALQAVAYRPEGKPAVYKTNLDLINFAVNRKVDFQQKIDVIPMGSADEYISVLLRDTSIGLSALIDETIREPEELEQICRDNFGDLGKNCDSTIFPFRTQFPAIKLGIAIVGEGSNTLLGLDQQVGANIAKAYFNRELQAHGVSIDLVYEYTKDSKDKLAAVEPFQKLLRQNVVAIIGPTYSNQAFQVITNTAVLSAEVPIIGPSNTAEGISALSDYNLRISAPVTDYVKYAVKAVYFDSGKLITNVATIYLANNQFTESEAAAFRLAFNEYPPQSLITETYTANRDEYQRVVAAVFTNQPDDKKTDLIVISGLQEDGVAIIRELRSHGYHGKIIGGNGLNTTEILEPCAQACDHLYIAQAYNYGLRSQINEEFRKAYADYPKKIDDSHPTNPSQLAAQMFTAVQVVTQALIDVDEDRKANGQYPIRKLDLSNNTELKALRNELNRKLLAHKLNDTVLGSIDIDQEGEIKQTVFCVAQVDLREQKPQFKILYGPEFGQNCENGLALQQ